MSKIQDHGFKWLGFDRESWTEDWARAEKWDITYPCPVENKAGAVLLLDVIEHSVNPGLALQNISDAMHLDGVLIVTVPNPHWSASRLHNVVFGCPSGFTKLDLDSNHHVFTPWTFILERMVNDAGFRVEKYVTLDGKSRLLRHKLSFLRVAIEYFDKTACGMSYGFICRKILPRGPQVYSKSA